ncbi:hypothetical protein [Pseudomonas guineae]|uniref:hypothetical protein n=1 Tax=Pseudomonas guineae TaxID=425504 RepID=UPI00142D6F99|nr:hypothetical protein [Pseudomonas guineae]
MLLSLRLALVCGLIADVIKGEGEGGKNEKGDGKTAPDAVAQLPLEGGAHGRAS